MVSKIVLLLLTATLGVESFQQSILRRSPLFHSRPAVNGDTSSKQIDFDFETLVAQSPTTSLPSSSVVSDNKDEDTLLKFSKDVKRVLHDLRGSSIDPTIPNYLVNTSSSLSYSKTWTLEDWERHNNRKRYIRYLVHFPKSRLLRRIIPQQSALFIWTLLSMWIEDHFFKKRMLPITALGTISTFLAFLLTLRSNQGLSRLDEARRTWSKVVLHTREMSQLISAFIYPVDKQLGLMLARHVAMFGWLLKSELRFTRKEDVADIVKTMLPNETDAEYVLSQRQKAIAVVVRIRQVIHHLAKDHRLSTAEEIALDHTAHALSDVITATGRIRTTPIPTLYTSHTSRLLVFYLFCLPPALHWSGLDTVMTTIITMVVGYAMLGLDEISHLFEQPFRVIPMYQISKRSMLAVADALTCRPPSLTKDKSSDDEHERLTQKELTSYWGDGEFSQIILTTDDTVG
jgi:predicted membrane chloride channel (bestrophin family)